MSFVFKRDGRWYIGFLDETGCQVRRKSSATTREAAKRLAALEEEHAEKVRLGHAAPREPPHTWDELCARYLKDVVPSRKSAKGITSRLKKHMAPAFKGRLLARIKPGDVQAWLTKLQAAGMKASSRETCRVGMQAIFTYGQTGLGWCDSNPAKEAGRVEVPKRQPRYLTQGEALCVLAAAPEWLRPPFAVALYCGLRKGELCGLRWEDVDLVDMLLHVRRSYARSPKAGRERAVGIPVDLLPYLAQAKRMATGSEWVFPNPDGEMRPSWHLDSYFRRALKAAGVEKPLTFRHTRSTFGTHLYRLSKDIRGVQVAIGHADLKTTINSYAAVPDGLLKELAGLLSYGTPTQLPAGEVIDVTPEAISEKALVSPGIRTTQTELRPKRRYQSPRVVTRTGLTTLGVIRALAGHMGTRGTPAGLSGGGA